MAVTYHVGDSRAVIAGIPDGSVDLIASSPPFLALRSYLPAGHEAKGDEIGSEANPAAFLDTLLELTAEWGRVLAPHGSLAIELGDTYSGSGGGDAALSYRMALNGERDKGGKTESRDPAGWPLAKSLALIPQLYAVALAYGINPLTGQPSPAGRWRVRNVIVWHRPNPAVGALGDKVRPSTSYIVVATRSAKRWFDLTAVRTPVAYPNVARTRSPSWRSPDRDNREHVGDDSHPAGAPPLDAWFDPYDSQIVEGEGCHYSGETPSTQFHDTWTLTTQPSSLAHYAMWPAKLAERLILMMCPREVCRVCGEPRRRMEGAATLDAYRASDRTQTRRAVALADQHGLSDAHIAAVRAFGTSDVGKATTLNNGAGKNTDAVKLLAAEAKDVLGGYFREFVMSTNMSRESTWTDCGHDGYRPGLTLDPFAGTGTTLAVADLHGRDAIGIDIDERNRDIYPARYDEVKRALFGTPPPMPGQEAFDFAI